MQREAGAAGGAGLPMVNINATANKFSQSSLESKSNFYQHENQNNKVETDGVDLNDIENTSMTDIQASGQGITSSAK